MPPIKYTTFMNRLLRMSKTTKKKDNIRSVYGHSDHYVLKVGDRQVGSFSFFRHGQFRKDEMDYLIGQHTDHSEIVKNLLGIELAKIRGGDKRLVSYYHVNYLEVYPEFRGNNTAIKAFVNMLKTMKIERPSLVTFSVQPQDVDVSPEVLARWYSRLGWKIVGDEEGILHGYQVFT